MMKASNLIGQRAREMISGILVVGCLLFMPINAEMHASTRVAQTFTISGQVTDGFGNIISGATVTLSGAQSGTTTSDGSGNYSFPNLQGGVNYQVGASLPGRQDTVTFV